MKNNKYIHILDNNHFYLLLAGMIKLLELSGISVEVRYNEFELWESSITQNNEQIEKVFFTNNQLNSTCRINQINKESLSNTDSFDYKRQKIRAFRETFRYLLHKGLVKYDIKNLIIHNQ